MKKRIYYHDTDCGGVVYYANYLKYLEESRVEFLEGLGVGLKNLAEQGILFVVARQEIDYKFPAVYADVIEVTSRIDESSAVRLNFAHEIFNQDRRLLVKAKTVLVCVGSDLKPRQIPGEIKKKIS